MREKKIISRDTYLKALGLFMLASSHVKKADEFGAALEELLEVPEEDRKSSHFFDALYGSNEGSLDVALKKADYVVEPENAAT